MGLTEVLIDYCQKSISELVRKSIQLEIMNQITKCITIEMSFDEMMENISATLREVIDYDLLSFCIIENQRKLIIKTGVPKTIIGFQVGQSIKGNNSQRSIAWKVIKDKKFIIREDIMNDAFDFAEDQALKDFGIRSAVIVPLIVKNKVTGTFNLGSRKKANYDNRDADFLQQVADHLAVSFENARLYIEESKIKNELEETFKAVTDIFYVIDKNYTLLRFNEYTYEFAKSLGVQPTEGMLCYKIFGESGEKCENCPAKETMNSGESAVKRSYSRFNRIWDGYAYPVYTPDGMFDKVIVAGKDVTKRIEVEAQLIQSAKLADMGIITAGIAHELNSPLTAVIGDALLLEQQKESFSEGQRELISDIRQCGIRCKDIILTVRNFARKDNDAWEPIDINSVSNDALKLVSFQIQKNIKLLVDLSPEIPLVRASRQHLEQLVVNLLLNARDAVEHIEIPCIHISTGYLSNEKQLFISVNDNGCGMHPEEMANIFNAFYTTKQANEGTGLGLSICKRIAEEHNGRMEVFSEQGTGSRFTLFLPEWQGGEMNARET